MAYLPTQDGPKFFGIYLGTVLKTDEEEPPNEVAGRLKIRIPMIHGTSVKDDQLPWAYPVFPSTCPQGGFIDIPEVNSWVLVAFQDGDCNAPLWLGGWHPANRFPYRAKYRYGYSYPRIKMWRTSKGQMVRMTTEEAVEIFAGNGPLKPPEKEGEEPKPEHTEWDTYIRMDLIQKRMTIKSKYPLTIQSDAKIRVKGVDVDVIAQVQSDYSGRPIVDLNGTGDDGQPVFTNHRGSKLVLRCIDATGKTAGELGLGPAKTGFAPYTTPDGQSGISPITVASTITMTPAKVTCQARHVRGFKDR